MLKRIMALSLAICIIGMVAGCKKKEATLPEANLASKYMGVSVTLPSELLVSDYSTLFDPYTTGVAEIQWVKIDSQFKVDFLPYELTMLLDNTKNPSTPLTDEQKAQVQNMYANMLKPAFAITAIVHATTKTAFELNAVTGYPNNELIKRKGGLDYYFSWGDYQKGNAIDQSENVYKILYDNMDKIKKSIKFTKPDKTQPLINESPLKEGVKIGKFKTVDFEGKDVTENIFSKNKLTLVYIWQTDMQPSIDLLADLQRLSDEYKGKVKILGIVTDKDVEQKDEATKFTVEKQATFENIFSDDNLKNNLFSKMITVPTAIFVDKYGTIKGTAILSVRTYDEYKSEIDTMLNKSKTNWFNTTLNDISKWVSSWFSK